MNTTYRYNPSSAAWVSTHANRRPSSAAVPAHVAWMFLAFTVYVAAPVADIPLLGLSLSAPILYLIALSVLVKHRAQGLSQYRRWLRFAVAFWAGIVVSFFANFTESFSSHFDPLPVLYLVRFAYWMLAFVLTVYIVNRGALGPRLPVYLGGAIVGLACLVLLERLFLGTMTAGAVSRITGLSQNSYGWQFSTFASYLLVPAISGRGWAKALGTMGLLVVWAAAAVNLSRSSWIAIAVGLVVLVVLYSVARRTVRGFVLAVFAGSIMVLAASWAPSPLKERVLERYQTVERLDTDKSYQIRLLMVQKAWRLFKENPIAGVGPSRFTKSSTSLDRPRVLSYASQEHFDEKSAHNSYALLLAEGGLVCVMPFAVLFLYLLTRGAQAAVFLCRRGEPWGLGVYASFVGMSVHLWSLAGLTGTAPWVTYGLAAAVIERASALKGHTILRRSFR